MMPAEEEKLDRVHWFSTATIRTGPPLPPRIFIGRASTTNPFSGSCIQVGNVLKGRNVLFKQADMTLKVSRLTKVNTRSVDTHRPH